MITAHMLTKSWNSVYAKYRDPEAEGTPEHVEEGIAALDHGEVMLEKQAFKYDVDFLRRMVPQALVEQESDSDSESEVDIGGREELDDIAGSPSSSFHSFPGPSATGVCNSFQRSLLQEESGKPSPSTPKCRKRCASTSVSLTLSMGTRFQNKLRPTQRRNYKVCVGMVGTCIIIGME